MMKKDMIIHNNLINIFGESCEVCGGAHILQKCPFLFGQFNKEKIIKNYNLTSDLQRNNICRKKKYKSNCIIELDYIQDRCLQFIIKNDDFLRLDLEEINVEDLLGNNQKDKDENHGARH